MNSDSKSTWLVAPNGAVTKWVPPPPKPIVRLSSGQQHMAMRLALDYVLKTLESKGFKTNCIEQSSCSINVAHGGVNFDIGIRTPANIAFITSRPESHSSVQRQIGSDIYGTPVYAPGPNVKFASDEIRGKWVVQIIGSRVSSGMPIYVECPPDEADPVRYIFKNILQVIASFVADKNLLHQIGTDTSALLPADVPNYIQLDSSD